MAFYQDRNKQGKEQKRRKAEARGGFEDEGSRYSSSSGRIATAKGKLGAPTRGNPRSPLASAEGGRPSGKAAPGARPSRSQNADKTGGYRFAIGTPQHYQERGSGATPRPYGEQKEARRVQPEAPARRTAPVRKAAPSRAPRPAQAPRSFESFRYDGPPAHPVPSAPAGAEYGDSSASPDNLLSGRNPIREALKSGRDIEKLLVARGELSGSAREIVQMSKEKHIPVQEVDRVRLDAITPGHQGMLAFASAYHYHSVDDMLSLAQQKGEPPFLVILDGITDPHNLGAIIRTAECAGAHGVIVQERRAVGLTPAAVKASAGAVEYLPVARVTNLSQTIAQLKKQGIWLFAADMEGEGYATVDFSGPLALVIGGEGEGISRLVLEACDRRVAVPVRGQLDSLNASVAAGILLYAALKAR